MDRDDFFGRNIVSMSDFSREEIDFVLNFAKEIKQNPEGFKFSMKDKIMAPLFFENSTRTSTSFQMAMHHMGGKVMDFDLATSSVKKGETLSDTLMMMKGYSPDVVVLRHNNSGAARFACDIMNCPVINAGDGQNQHPTQTMLDLFTIKEIRGEIDGVKIAMVGDLKYGRTVHSLSLALAKYLNCKIYFISPESLKMPRSILSELKDSDIDFRENELDEFSDILSLVDIVYMTRIQRERFPLGNEGEQEYNKIKKEYLLDKRILKNANPSLKIMHPLPKIFEISPEIDNTSFAYYFKQAENGLYVRQALLNLILNKVEDEDEE